ncbi:MAG: glycosyltransferase family 2 protein [Chloroflexia bacterium]|nr:glycosyltransferase family 2 protein [Chloroflexia bacterium]
MKVYTNEKNLGDYPNRNKAAEYASGKYIKYLDSDDLIYPHGMEVMVKMIEQFPTAAYALSYAKAHEYRPYPFSLTPEEAYKEHFLQRGLFNEGPTSLIFNTEIFRKEGGFKVFKVYGDAEMLFRLSAKYPMVKMQPALTWWRQHEGQEFDLGHKNNEYFNGTYLLSMEFLESENCPLNNSDRMRAVNRLKRYHARKILSLGLGSKKLKPAWNYLEILNCQLKNY